ncbi:DUF4112 domain-containing protein [Marinobacter sp. NP-4(2019)]|uniref:DUF4112 domain-containing protein n=1 Tax=Marinobacter sp. NP-4(2019) TaxID=2488665 RepID=UPI000FC3EDB9|nr:DUF4112 domain-containing protein [Marinobacter sp. NP-4(2019)]AZT84772.1 DUF4112 domain-containing protein [Marinobacter sp. NP-4(2019)]
MPNGETTSDQAELRTRQQATLARLDRFSRVTDTAIRIPFTRIRLGLDPIIGLLPVVGDLIGLVLSLYVLLEAQRAGASKRIKAHMIKNMLIETFGGMVPVVGDAFDIVYKANTRNTRLLREYLEEELKTEPQPRFPWTQVVFLAILLAILTSVVMIAW